MMEDRDRIVSEVLKLLPDLARGLRRGLAAHGTLLDSCRDSTASGMVGDTKTIGAEGRGAAVPRGDAHSSKPERKVTPAMMRTWIHLAQYGSQTMGELAEGLKISTASATDIVQPLVELGYVKRSRDPGDRRVVRVSLTEEAQALADQILAELRAEVQSALADLDDEACRCFLAGLERLAARWR